MMGAIQHQAILLGLVAQDGILRSLRWRQTVRRPGTLRLAALFPGIQGIRECVPPVVESYGGS